jgi:hypothetical protein
MSRLSVYWPDESKSSRTSVEEPRILPFPSRRTFLSTDVPKLDIVTRARTLYENRTCRQCGYAVVEPIQLSDSLVNKSGLAIPGTATLIGFRCCGCESEWSI